MTGMMTKITGKRRKSVTRMVVIAEGRISGDEGPGAAVELLNCLAATRSTMQRGRDTKVLMYAWAYCATIPFTSNWKRRM